MRYQQFADDTFRHYIIEGNPWGYDDRIKRCSFAAGCAVGRHLPLDFAQTCDNESISLNSTLDSNPLLIRMLDYLDASPEDRNFLWDMQSWHDFAATQDINTTIADMRKLYERYGLDPTLLEAAASHRSTP